MKYILAILISLIPLSASAHVFKVIKYHDIIPVVYTFDNCQKSLQIDFLGNAIIDLSCTAHPYGDSSQDLSPPNPNSAPNWSYTVRLPHFTTATSPPLPPDYAGENCRVVYHSDPLQTTALDCRPLVPPTTLTPRK